MGQGRREVQKNRPPATQDACFRWVFSSLSLNCSSCSFFTVTLPPLFRRRCPKVALVVPFILSSKKTDHHKGRSGCKNQSQIITECENSCIFTFTRSEKTRIITASSRMTRSNSVLLLELLNLYERQKGDAKRRRNGRSCEEAHHGIAISLTDVAALHKSALVVLISTH